MPAARRGGADVVTTNSRRAHVLPQAGKRFCPSCCHTGARSSEDCSMLRPTVYQASLAALLSSTLAVAPVAAQSWRNADDWQENCRENNDNMPHVCVIKTTSFHPHGAISVEPLVNDAVAFVGWDADSVLVEARITARAGSARDAQTLADAIQLGVSGGQVHAEGPAGRN